MSDEIKVLVVLNSRQKQIEIWNPKEGTLLYEYSVADQVGAGVDMRFVRVYFDDTWIKPGKVYEGRAKMAVRVPEPTEADKQERSMKALIGLEVRVLGEAEGMMPTHDWAWTLFR